MALTGEELTDEIQELVGRTSNIVLVDDTRCARWLNEAQRKIVDECPGIQNLLFKNATSLDTTQSLAYPIEDITVGDETSDEIAHIFDVWYIDGADSYKIRWMHVDEFDLEYPDPSSTDFGFDRPSKWTRRGSNIEMFPLCACGYCNKDLRIDGDVYAGDFATNDTTASDISDADDILIAYGIHKAWGAIGDEGKSQIWKMKYIGLLDDFKTKQDGLQQWDGNMYS